MLEGIQGLEPGAREALEMLQQVFVAMTTEVMLDDTDPQSMSSGGGIPLDWNPVYIAILIGSLCT